MTFSHPPAEPARSSAPTRDEQAHENLFHEPEYAPGTTPALPVEPAPVRRSNAGTARRTTRRRRAA